MPTHLTIMAFVRHAEKFLFLKRAPHARLYPEKWQMVTGHIQENETAENAALREVKEETGLEVTITQSHPSFEYEDENARFVIVPFIMDSKSDVVTLNPSEHTEHRWIKISDYKTLDCLPGIEGDLRAVELI